MVRIKLAVAMVFVLLGGAAFLSPERALSENVSRDAGRRITLLNRRHYHSFEKASLSFRDNVYDPVRGPFKDRDLLYGALNYNGDRDWFTVAFGRRDQSRIQDLGKMDWSDDIAVPVLPILPCPKNEPCHRIQIPSSLSGKTILEVNPHLAKPVVGHMYVVHTYDEERDLLDFHDFDLLLDFYTLVRVEELKPNEKCTITWKRIASPKN